MCDTTPDSPVTLSVPHSQFVQPESLCRETSVSSDLGTVGYSEQLCDDQLRRGAVRGGPWGLVTEALHLWLNTAYLALSGACAGVDV